MNGFLKHCLNIVLAFIVVVVLLFVWLGIMSPDWEGDVRTINKEQFRDWLATIEAEENENLTADKLREYCDEQDGTYPEGVCTGYLLGYVEGFGMQNTIDFCVYDEEFSASQMEQAFRNFMEDNPKYWKKSRGLILGAALQDAFPCSEP